MAKLKVVKIKFLGIFPVNKNQFIWIETFFFIFFLIMTVFFFSYRFPAYIDDPLLVFHAKYLKYAALIATFLIVIEAQYVLNLFIKDQKQIIEEQNRELKQQKEEILRQKEEIQAQRDLAQQQYEIIAEQKKHITDSIVYASTIQRAMLPEYIDLLRDYEYFIFFRPKEIVSGDFYWFYKKGERLFVAAADCTGHGVPGAFVSMLGMTYLNDIMAKSPDNIMPHQILEQIRQKIIKTFTRKNDQAPKDGMDIAIYVIEPDKQTLHFAGANNPLYIIRKNENNNFPQQNNRIKLVASEKHTLIHLKGDKMPVGKFQTLKPFTLLTINIMPDDRLYVFSDGFIDQIGGNLGRRFGSAQFKRLLLSIQDLSMEEQKKVLNQTLDQWIHQNPKLDIGQLDDVLVLGIKIK